MLHLLALWLLNTLAVMITAYVVPGFVIEGFGSAMIAAVIIGVVNATLRWVLVFLTLPLTIVTFGLFLFVVNALCLIVASWLTPGFRVKSFGWALLAAVILALTSDGLHYLALKL
jgi:putative membrane protein